MKLSRTALYAIQAIVQLGAAGPGALVPSRQLAQSGEIPERFLLQILRGLVAEGLLTSKRGVFGGYSLGRGLEEISLLDIIEAVEGPLVLEMPPLPAPQRKLAEALRAVSMQVRADLAAIKVSQLITGVEEPGR